MFFTSKFKPFLDAISEQAELYVPQKCGQHYIFAKYDPSVEIEPEFNNIRTCVPAKEFLFPLREIVAALPEPFAPEQQKPFALFGLKDCDIRSIEILDKVFTEQEFLDPFYVTRRQNMIIISSDCSEPAQSCCCNLFGGKPFPDKGFDLNVSKTENGCIFEVGSKKGQDLIEKHKHLFADVPSMAVEKRQADRARTQSLLEQNNAAYKLDSSLREVAESGQDSDIFDTEAQSCVECHACTRVCPTCHCFYLYDTKRDSYFGKMKMWDSCIRLSYAQVAGGANPRKKLGERLKHRFMHKFSYFLDRYGIDMCIGCGRCIDAETGLIDIRVVLKKLNDRLKQSIK